MYTIKAVIQHFTTGKGSWVGTFQYFLYFITGLFGRFEINVYICSTISKGTYRLVVLTPQTRRIKLFQHESFERRRKEAVLLADGNSHPQFIVLVYYSGNILLLGC